MQTSIFWLKFGNLSPTVNLKNRSRSQNQISSSSPNVIAIQIWLKSANQSMRYGAHKSFWLKFGSLCPTVTLKIRSRSAKPNQLFIMSQCYIRTNLVKIHPSVHEISCKQESVKMTPTSTRSAPKTICPLLLRWGA